MMTDLRKPRLMLLSIMVCNSHNIAAAFVPSPPLSCGKIRPLPLMTPDSSTKSPFSIPSCQIGMTSTRGSLFSISAITSSSAMRAIPFPPSTVRNVMAVGVVLLFVILTKHRRRTLLYPGSSRDLSYSEPLPPGSIDGCPWIGNLPMLSSMNKAVHDKAAKLGNPPPKIFKLFGFTKPMVILSGSATIKKLLNREFKKEQGVSQATDFGGTEYYSMMLGKESLSFETKEAKRYHHLQKLVGQALTPENVAKGIPSLQEASEKAVDRMLESDQAVMADINRYLTLDVAWKQILGLNLKGEEEIQDFHRATTIWLKGVMNYFYVIFPFPASVLRMTREYKAKAYLTRKIEDKIDELERNGPDGSTMSAMVFAADEKDELKKLSRQQVIDNALLLIIAGSETSSVTLTNAMLFIGMNPGVWTRLVAEQEELVAEHGTDLTKYQIDNDCPYLDAVIRETMRILPISGGGARNIDDTIVQNGVQIPKNWMAMYSISLTHEQDPKTWKSDGSHMDIHTGFQPERWLEEDTRPTSAEFMPWGAGHRFCVGHHLASAEMKTFLAVMARRVKGFDLLTNVNRIKWTEGIIITPKDGVVVAVHKLT